MGWLSVSGVKSVSKAHSYGHQLGLGDEYRRASKSMNELAQILMRSEAVKTRTVMEAGLDLLRKHLGRPPTGKEINALMYAVLKLGK